MSRLKNLASLLTRPKPPVGMTPADVVHRENKWRLLHYRANPSAPQRFDTPVLLVPSLINRHYVMDLLPGKSMAEDLVAKGHDVYCIDWGTPTDEDRFVSFDDVCDTYLGRAIRKVAKASTRGKVHVLGYCLGGTLAASYVAAFPDGVASLLALAAPIDFAHGGIMTTWTRTPTFDVAAIINAFGNVPHQLMQASFSMLRPTLRAQKMVAVLDRAWDDEFLDGFLATETWGSDNVSFPGACYAQYITELYRENRLIKGEFSVLGRRALLSNITCPVLAIAFTDDHIVPVPSAQPLIDAVGGRDKQILVDRGGHVGAVVSRKAAGRLWPAMSTFWAQRDA